jgi:hypothetical protein
VWSAYVGDKKVGSIDLNITNSGTYGPYASAEVEGVREADNVLGPVEFRGLAYMDTSGAWHEASDGVTVCCYSVTSDTYYGDYPYGVAGVPGDNNHWLAGSNLPKRARGDYLWPWYQVTVSSPLGSSSGTGWYVKHSTISPSASQTIPINEKERYNLNGWSMNGTTAHSFSYTVEQNMNLVAVYSKQYLVTATSPYGTVQGSGWYDEGSEAVIKVDPTIINEGWLGTVGVRQVFRGWEGTDPSTGDSKLIVNVPITINAKWTLTYDPIIGIALIAICVVGYITISWRTRLLKPLSKIRLKKPIRPTMFCKYCGEEIPRRSTYCKECGGKLEQRRLRLKH